MLRDGTIKHPLLPALWFAGKIDVLLSNIFNVSTFAAARSSNGNVEEARHDINGAGDI
jgi:hypothetical protein